MVVDYSDEVAPRSDDLDPDSGPKPKALSGHRVRSGISGRLGPEDSYHRLRVSWPPTHVETLTG